MSRLFSLGAIPSDRNLGPRIGLRSFSKWPERHGGCVSILFVLRIVPLQAIQERELYVWVATFTKGDVDCATMISNDHSRRILYKILRNEVRLFLFRFVFSCLKRERMCCLITDVDDDVSVVFGRWNCV